MMRNYHRTSNSLETCFIVSVLGLTIRYDSRATAAEDNWKYTPLNTGVVRVWSWLWLEKRAGVSSAEEQIFHAPS